MVQPVSSLCLIRHGQASFGAADYDQLSALGVEQARRAGMRLGRARPHLAALYSGPRRRQIDSATHLRAAARELGVVYPEPVVVEAFDELPVRHILAATLPELIAERAAGDARLAALVATGDLAGARAALSSAEILALVARAVRRWAEGGLASGRFESPAQFRARVESALVSLAPDGDQAVAVVTSGGPIAVALHVAAGIGPGEAFERALQLANASLTELEMGPGRLRLVEIDPVGHLLPEQITYV
jgi:broad specificity phosphatase PhoE